MPDEHARFSPSATTRWLACPWTVDPEGPDPERKDTVWTVRGTAMHTRAEKHLRAWTDPAQDFTPIYYKDHEDPNRELMMTCEEWHPHVVPYIAAIRGFHAEAEMLGYKPELLIENRVEVHGKWCWGTLDAAIVVPSQMLVVFDLKTGGGHIVEPKALQFQTYAVGLCDRYGWDFLDIRLGRAQAAAQAPVAVEQVSLDELRNHKAAIRKAIQATLKRPAGGGPTRENLNAECHWCPRYETCPARFDRAMKVLEDHDVRVNAKHELVLPDPSTLSDRKLGWLVLNMDEIIHWFKKVREHLTAQAVAGRSIPLGLKLVEGETKRRWKRDMPEDVIAKQIVEAAEMLGEKIDPWDKSLVSFATVEKLLGKGSIDALLEKPKGKPALAPDDDNRPNFDKLACLKEVDGG